MGFRPHILNQQHNVLSVYLQLVKVNIAQKRTIKVAGTVSKAINCANSLKNMGILEKLYRPIVLGRHLYRTSFRVM